MTTGGGGVGFRGVAMLMALLLAAATSHAQTVLTKTSNAIEAASNTTGTDGRVPLGASGGDTGGIIGCAVLKDGAAFKMWYGGNSGTPWIGYYATSPDGLTWTKVNNAVPTASNTTGTDGRIPLGTSGGDTLHTYRCSVIKDGLLYKMWYSGFVGSNGRIYYATSADGLTWTKTNNAIPAASNTTGTDGRIPLGTSGGDTVYAQNPTVIKVGDTYRMWYGGYGTDSKWRIYHATSSDGLTWTKVDNSIPAASNTTGTNGRIPLGTSGGDTGGVFPLEVIKDDNVYRMWYAGYTTQWLGIYAATSPDGLTWTKRNNAQPTASNGSSTDGRIPIGGSGRGDATAVIDGGALRDGATYKVWYAGYAADAKWRLFLATAPADHPTVSNVTAESVGPATADLVGHLVATGAAPATVRVFYGTNDAGTIGSQWETNALLGERAAGVWTHTVTGLLPLTTYAYRFHATNSFGEDWADEAGSFTTLADALMVQARPASAVGVQSATLNGRVLGVGYAENPAVSFCLDTADRGTAATGAWARVIPLGANWGAGESFAAELTDLLSGSNYTYRCHVTNSSGEVWSDDAPSFTTIYISSVTNLGAAGVTPQAAWLQGQVTDTGTQIPAAWFRYWADGATQTSTVAAGLQAGVFSNRLAGLPPDTLYHYEILVSNAAGAALSTVSDFTTAAGIYVATNGPADGDGTSWAMAFTNIQRALDTAGPDAQICLAGHTFWVPSELAWTNTASSAIRGGWQGVGTPGSNDPALWPTVIRRLPSVSVRILRVNAVTGTLAQVTIQNGKIVYSGSGGGVYVSNSALTFDRCRFASNELYGSNVQYLTMSGGGIYATASDIVITNCTLMGNQVYGSWRRGYNYGGGFYITGGSLRIADSRFSNNGSIGGGNVSIADFASYGGAIYANCPVTVSRSVFSGNQATAGAGPCVGGGIYAIQGLVVQDSVFSKNNTQSGNSAANGGGIYATVDVTLRNVLFASNTVVGAGAGVYVYNGAFAMDSCTLASNVGEAVYVRQAPSFSARNSIFWSNTDDLWGFPTNAEGVLTNVWYCDIEDGDNLGVNGCISADPLFADPARGDYRPQTAFLRWSVAANDWVNEFLTSPCIDAGTNLAWMSSATDLDGLPRLSQGTAQTPVADMGAYEAKRTPTVLQILIANVGATNVADTTADLVGDLTATGGSATTVWAFWDTTDHTTNKTWAHSASLSAASPGLITNAVSGLPPNQTNYFTYYASNSESEVWTQPSLSFKTWGPPSVADRGATDIWNTHAILWGALLNGNGAYASVMWGTNETGLTSASTPMWVTEGAFSIPVAGLMTNTTYYYQFVVSNAYGTGTSAITNFTTKLFLGHWYVATNGPAGGDGMSWAAAFTNVQQALDAVMANNEIRLAGHTFSVKGELAWIGVTNVLIQGGWEGVGTPGSNNPALWPTTIRRLPSVAATRILRASAVTGTLAQVTILNGKIVDGSPGGGIQVSGSLLTLDDCRIVSNEVYGGGQQYFSLLGGGLYAAGSAIAVTNCVFTGNQVYGSWRRGNSQGGGIHMSGGSLAVVDSRFSNNGSIGGGSVAIADYSSYGGAIYANCPVTVRGSLFSGNLATVGAAPCGGGGIYGVLGLTVQESVLSGNRSHVTEGTAASGGGLYATVGATLRNVLLASNTVDGSGAGVYVYSGAFAMDSCTVATNGGAGVHVRLTSSLSARNSIFWSNADDLWGFPTNAAGILTNVWYCDISDRDNEGTNGCVSVDPLFHDDVYFHLNSGAGTYLGGYFSGGAWGRGTGYSPLIDAGDPSSPYDLEPGPNGRRANMGAYGNTPVASKTVVPGSLYLVR